MPKRKAEEPEPAAPASQPPSASSVATSLTELKSTLGDWGAERRAAAVAAEQKARDALVARVKALPPRQCFSPAALSSFKKRHLAMMNTTTAPETSKTPPPE